MADLMICAFSCIVIHGKAARMVEPTSINKMSSSNGMQKLVHVAVAVIHLGSLSSDYAYLGTVNFIVKGCIPPKSCSYDYFL